MRSSRELSCHALLGTALLAGVACFGAAPATPPTWRLVWRGDDGRRYYADTSTVRRAGDSVAVVAWDLMPLAATGIRAPHPHANRARESIRIACTTREMTGARVTTVEGVQHSYSERDVVTFAGRADAGTPHAALASFLCDGTRTR